MSISNPNNPLESSSSQPPSQPPSTDENFGRFALNEIGLRFIAQNNVYKNVNQLQKEFNAILEQAGLSDELPTRPIHPHRVYKCGKIIITFVQTQKNFEEDILIVLLEQINKFLVENRTENPIQMISIFTQSYIAGQPNEPPGPPDDGSGGGPASKPIPCDSEDPKCKFDPPPWAEEVCEPNVSTVKVYVLDTAIPTGGLPRANKHTNLETSSKNSHNPNHVAPSLSSKSFEQMVTPLPDAAAAYGRNTLLNRMNNDLGGMFKITTESAFNAIPPGNSHITGDIQVFRQTPHIVDNREYPYLAMDHGLFISGMIRSIVEDVEIHLIEVLNAYAHGKFEYFIKGLTTICKDVNANEQIVINASLNFSYDDPQYELIIRDILRELDCRLDPTNCWGTPSHNQELQNIAFVVAAGNDYGTPVTSAGDPIAKTPANYPEATPVASYYQNSGSSMRTGYSNFGRRNDRNNNLIWGFAAFGGTVDGGSWTDQGVVGLYIGAFPDKQKINPMSTLDDNNTGWGYWSGTSFAAPIVSACLAHLVHSGCSANMNKAIAKLYTEFPKPTGEETLINLLQKHDCTFAG